MFRSPYTLSPCTCLCMPLFGHVRSYHFAPTTLTHLLCGRYSLFVLRPSRVTDLNPSPLSLSVMSVFPLFKPAPHVRCVRFASFPLVPPASLPAPLLSVCRYPCICLVLVWCGCVAIVAATTFAVGNVAWRFIIICVRAHPTSCAVAA